MTLRQGEYKIQDDGIWIARSELERWRKRLKVADKNKKAFKPGLGGFEFPYYLGKAEVLTDLIKMFDDLEGE